MQTITFTEFREDEEEEREESSQSDDDSPTAGDCAICDNRAHGVHFGVLACRACAAFFKRCVISGKRYRCKSKTGKCEIIKGDTKNHICRRCRFNKCLRLGMTAEKVKNGGAKGLTSNNSDEPKRLQLTPFIPSIPLSTPLSTVTHNDIKVEVDLDSVMEKFNKGMNFAEVVSPPDAQKQILDMTPATMAIQTIFAEYKPKIEIDMPLRALQRQMIALKHYRRKQLCPPQELKVMDYKNHCNEWFADQLRVAEWMNHCEEFEALPIAEKLSLFRMTWFGFQRLERMHLSLGFFGEEVFSQKKMAVFNKYYITDQTVSLRRVFTDHDEKYFESIEDPFDSRFILEIARPVQRLNIDSFELVFMLCQLMWHVEGRQVSDATRHVADQYRERISHELHDYYVHIQREPSYAGRLMRIMEIVHQLEKIVHERGEIVELTKVLNVLEVDLINNEQIYDNTV